MTTYHVRCQSMCQIESHFVGITRRTSFLIFLQLANLRFQWEHPVNLSCVPLHLCSFTWWGSRVIFTSLEKTHENSLVRSCSIMFYPLFVNSTSPRYMCQRSYRLGSHGVREKIPELWHVSQSNKCRTSSWLKNRFPNPMVLWLLIIRTEIR